MEEYDYFNAYLVKQENLVTDNQTSLEGRYTFTQPILPADSDNTAWMVGVATASLRAENLPLCVWNSNYWVGLEFGGVLYTGNCPWSPPTNLSTNVNYVYNMNDICDSFNTGISSAVAALNTAVPGTITDTPVLLFDESTQLFKLFVNISEFETPQTVTISVNRNWYNLLFNSFELFEDGTAPTFDSVSGYTNDYQRQLIIGPDFNNRVSSYENAAPVTGGTHRLISQKWQTPSSVFQIQAIRIYSYQANFRKETIPSTSTSWITQNSSQNMGSESVLIDLITLPSTYNDIRGKITYVADEIRWHNILNPDGIQHMSLKFMWIDNENNPHEIITPAGSVATIKLAFKKIKNIENMKK